ncbi:MAG: hypothetical protein LRZ88_12695 [Candidatus Cloacimonetes bacterium]|nr:hypothetical protein [Candidatus Cloacimonadota bacterium]
MIKLPLGSLMKEVYGPGGNVSLSAIAIFCAVCGIEARDLEQNIKREFKHSIEQNITYAEAVYKLVKELELGEAYPCHTARWAQESSTAAIN